MSPRSYWKYLDWLAKFVVAEPDVGQADQVPDEGARPQGLGFAGWVHHKPGGVVETNQVRASLSSVPVEHSALIIATGYWW